MEDEELAAFLRNGPDALIAAGKENVDGVVPTLRLSSKTHVAGYNCLASATWLREVRAWRSGRDS